MLLAQSYTELDFSKVVTHVSDVSEARSLPCGITIGDTCGGRSFNDNVAFVLENRSLGGWREVEQDQQRWTVIVLTR
jgi:hypothetical protein